MKKILLFILILLSEIVVVLFLPYFAGCFIFDLIFNITYMPTWKIIIGRWFFGGILPITITTFILIIGWVIFYTLRSNREIINLFIKGDKK